jgi:LemA protein
MSSTAIIVIALLAAAGFFVMIYNRLVALRQRRNNAFADIDVQLRQRYDLIPNLVETVKGYADHERTVLESVTSARTQVGQVRGMGADSTRIQAEAALGGALGRLFAVSENYPQLKADANFRELMAELADIENKIAAARRFFNGATSEYNAAIQQFPANLLAGLGGFHQELFFQNEASIQDAVQKAPDVKFH